MTIYLDYMSTTPVDPRVAEKMAHYLTLDGVFGNPASVTHRFGLEARAAVEVARQQVANLINADPKEIIWTSGATESDNLAIKGVAEFYQHKGRHIITCRTEHKAVLDTCDYLSQKGFDITYLDVNQDGLINLQDLADALREDTILVSIMHVNNETGVVQDIAAIGELTRQHKVLFHVDAAQSAGKLPLDMNTLPVDLMSLASHKIYGPKGIGALYVRRKPKVRLFAQTHGGGHEFGLRSGTLPTHQIVGMGEAFALASELLSVESIELARLRDRLWDGIKDMPGISINGSVEHRIAGILNIHVHDTDGESLIAAVQDQLAISAGSACSSTTVEPSHVLSAMGLTAQQANNSLRIAVGRFTTETDIDMAITLLRGKITWLRSISPLWPSVGKQS